MAQRTALITGATSGIGLGAARHLTDAGWTVWVTGRSLAKAEAAADQAGGRPLQLDVTDAASIAAAAGTVAELDALVNNAGVQPDFGIGLLEAGAEVFRESYETNVFGVAQVTNAFLPALRRSPAPRILNVSSGTSSFTWSTGPNPQFDHERAASSGGRFAVYRSSKTALNMLTLLYAQALDGDGIKVNALAPGARKTNLNPAMDRGADADEASSAIRTLLELPADSPTGVLFSYDGTIAPW
ncbi:MAG: SDR family NAD(P)-dependent oxidoreductase [Solirubrobacteraceae bacterium]|nr:SDR family NAD(P)-dependent oxidoreductase [Patulibacter sp.]